MKSLSKIILVGVLALFALTYFIWNTYQNARNAEVVRQWVDHSYQIIEKINRLNVVLNQVESDSRGWLLSGDTTFAQSVRQANLETNKLLRDLYRLTADNPRQQKVMPTLSALIAEKNRLHLNQIGSSPLVKSGLKNYPVRERELMDSIRLQLDNMRLAEANLLNVRVAQDKQFVRGGFITTLIGTIAALFFIAIILWQLNIDILRRKKAEQQLQQVQYRLQAILDNIPIMIRVKDLQGKYLLVNKKIKETFSFADEMLIGKTDDEIEPDKAQE